MDQSPDRQGLAGPFLRSNHPRP